jgi:hypothetical protein
MPAGCQKVEPFGGLRLSVPPETDAGDVHKYYIHDKNDINCSHYRELLKNRQVNFSRAVGKLIKR